MHNVDQLSTALALLLAACSEESQAGAQSEVELALAEMERAQARLATLEREKEALLAKVGLERGNQRVLLVGCRGWCVGPCAGIVL